MQSGGQYGIPPDMQQFVGGRGAPHMFGHSQNGPSISQNRSNLHQLKQHVQPHHQPLQHPELLSHAHQQPQQPHQQNQTINQQQPQLHQSMNLQHHHYHKSQPSHQQLVQQLGLDSNSPEVLAAGLPPSKFKQVFPAKHPLGDDGVQDEGERGNGCSRWPIEETIALLKFRSEMDATFRDSGFKGPLWEEVSRKLYEIGYHRSAKKCKEKFENVHKYYKKTKDGRTGRQDGKNYRFFSEMEALRAANNNDSGASGGSSSGGLGGMSTAKGHGGDLMEGGGGSSAAAVGAASVQRPEINSSALNLSSDYSEDDYVEPEDNDEQDSRKKRKRESWSPTKVFFEKLTKQMMEQQEALHQKFLDTIEKRDHERLIREEAYKRQEMARLNREQELRAQELALAATRDAALIAFLQKATGETLQLPKMPPPTTLTNVSEVQEDKEKETFDINTRRWPKVEVHALIRLRSGMEPRFQEAGPKAHLWQEISTSMACMGFSRSAKRCKEKWENINKYFKKTKDSCRKRPENAKTCPYFHQLDTLYQRGILASSSNKFNRIGIHSENLLENNTENFDLVQSRNSETLAIMPARENGLEAAQATSSTVVKLHSDRENCIEADPILMEATRSEAFPDPYGNPAPPSGTDIERVHAGEGTPGSKNSVQVEMFVKDILDMQQQQHQKLVDEYDRMEQAREIRELERRQKQGISLSHEQSHSNPNDNAALMALVHKLAGDSSDLTMSAPSSIE